MTNENENGKEFKFYYLILLFSFISFLICLIKVDSSEKRFMFFLPLSYFLFSILFRNNYRHLINNISILLIETLFFVRLVILPLVYSFFSSIQLFEGRASINDGFPPACFLMVYELLVVQFVIFIYNHVKRRHTNRKTCFTSIDISKGLIISLAIYILVITLFLPQYAGSFKSVLNLGDADFTMASERLEYSIGTIGRVIRTLYSIGFQIFRIIVPAYLLNQIYSKKKYSRLSGICLLVCCILQFFFLTSTFAEAIVACLAIILYYISLYPERRKKTFTILLASTAGMVIVYFTIRFFVNSAHDLYYKNSGIARYIGQILNAYFTGVDNVAAIFNIPSGHQAEALKADIIGAIPFNSTLFGTHGNKLQFFYNSANLSYGQIPPTIGVGYYYFSAFFAPVISALFVVLSMHYNYKSNHAGKSLRQIVYSFCSIVFALGTVMYSPSITLSWYLSWGVPMIFITIFTNSKEQS